MIHRNVLVGVAALALSRVVMACEAIDGSFVPVGEIVAINDQSMEYISKSLEVMLGASFERKAGVLSTISIHLKVDPIERVARMTHELSSGNQGFQRMHSVICDGDEWMMLGLSGKASIEGGARTFTSSRWYKIMPDGSLLIRYEQSVMYGLIFTSKKFFSATTKFAPFPKTTKQKINGVVLD